MIKAGKKVILYFTEKMWYDVKLLVCATLSWVIFMRKRSTSRVIYMECATFHIQFSVLQLNLGKNDFKIFTSFKLTLLQLAVSCNLVYVTKINILLCSIEWKSNTLLLIKLLNKIATSYAKKACLVIVAILHIGRFFYNCCYKT